MPSLAALALVLVLSTSLGESDVVRETKQGKVRGRTVDAVGKTVEVFKGIPYAEPPVGDLRFKEPVPRSPWEGTIDANLERIACSQAMILEGMKIELTYTEDCLFLNVWTPQNAQGRNVLVWIHGGGFAFDSAFSDHYSGLLLSAQTGYVVVSMNYRLGILGFLNADSPDAPGNQGLLDQNLALKWVRDNIEAFGGDPSKVTIVGESAGSMSVNCHLLSPMSKGLFRRAVMMSGTMFSTDFFDTVHESLAKGNDVAKMVGCATEGMDLASHPDEVLHCLRSKTADELVLATAEAARPKLFQFFPSFHDQILPKVPLVAMNRGFFNNVDVLAGITSDEGALVLAFPPKPDLLKESLDDINLDKLERKLHEAVSSWTKDDNPTMLNHYKNKGVADKEGLRRSFLDYLSDREFVCPQQFFAEKYAARGNALYSYVFAHRSKKDKFPMWMGTPHGYDISYVFGFPLINLEHFDEEDNAFHEEFVKILASFAENGARRSAAMASGETWVAFDSEQIRTFSIHIVKMFEHSTFQPTHFHSQASKSEAHVRSSLVVWNHLSCILALTSQKVQGKVRGRTVDALGKTVQVFKGIPYAEPPVGDLRFKEPVPRSPWEGTIDANLERIACSQAMVFKGMKVEPIYTEDCLFLNVWTPQNAQGRNVLVWIHGGGFAFDSAFSDHHSGLLLSAQTGYVVVSMNYRLGILGFLNAGSPDAPGNQGLLDQNLALKWVRDNIEAFGGDPSKVTIAGESAGSMSVNCHLLSPMSNGLFRRAVMMSGTMFSTDFFDTVHESLAKGNDVAKMVGCATEAEDLASHPDKVLHCLRSKTADELVLTTAEAMRPKLFQFFPSFHDQVLPKVPLVAMNRGFFNNVDVLAGITSDEAAIVLAFPPIPALLKESLDDINLDKLERELHEAVSSWTKDDNPTMLNHYKNKGVADKEGLRRSFLDYLSDREFVCPQQFFAEKYAARGNALYSYVFAHRSKKDKFPMWMGTPHGYDISYVSGFPLVNLEHFDEEDKAFYEEFVKILASFAENG
ncbi:unnamed protein product [Ixodes hexagonus]